MGKLHDLTGKQFGKWTVIKRAGSTANKAATWLCCCECGKERVIVGQSLYSGQSTQCLSCAAKQSKKKGDISCRSRIAIIFCGMHERCYNPNHRAYKYYGGRGITICDEWLLDRGIFYKWAYENGYTDELTIDRIDNDKGYQPDNCRFIPLSEQSRNRRCCHNYQKH